MKSIIKILLMLIVCCSISTSIISQGVSAPMEVLNLTTANEIEAAVQTDAVAEISNYLESNLDYPDQLQEFEISGQAMLKIKINEAGEIISKSIIQSSGKMFDENILNQLTNLKKVSPVYVNGIATTYAILIPIQYQPN